MAYSTLVSLETIIDQILDDDRYSNISPNGKRNIISIDKYVISFRAFLEDFPEKAENLEARIRDVAMEAEDIFEWFMAEQIRHYIFRYTHWIAQLRRIKFEFQLRKLRDEMDLIAGEVVEMKNNIIIKDAQPDHSVGASSSSPSQVADAGKIDMVGLNEDLIEIMDRLCGDSPQLQILPITGMGGIGKTTLARNVYGDPFIMEHFQIRVWVTISQDYSEPRVLSDLLDSLREFIHERTESPAEICEESNTKILIGKRTESPAEICEESNTKILVGERTEESNSEKAEKVYKILVGRKFLIVMDDTWGTKVLNDVKKLFPNDNNGSRILLTTRLADVAAYANSSIPPHEMHLMDAVQSWNLLRYKVFANQVCIPPVLENIGKDIARSCRGLPLALVVVAGLLSTVSKTQTAWEEIARNVKATLATRDGQIEKILSLSYDHLPHHLRPCFLYMGGFPEDHQIKVMDLIRLWIAEGFVKPVASKSFEDSAEEYMEDLIKRSLVIVSKSKSTRKIKHCSLHDLVRDLCIKQSQEEKFLVHVKGAEQLKSLKDERRISISRSDIDSFANIFSSTIRTIMYFQDTLGSFGSFRLLRVLDVLRVGSRSPLLPDQFFELFHLRYLAFCYYGPIPRAISNLQSLQTLIVKATYCVKFPRQLWNMPQLRHLITLGAFCDLIIVGTLALENLQTLVQARNLYCSLYAINMIPNLKRLNLQYYNETNDFPFHNLVHLRRLERLKLELLGSSRRPGAPNLVLPSSLKKLSLIGWGRSEPYLNIYVPLPNLEVLKLEKFDFVEQEWTTSDHDFPKLRFLVIENSNLKQWNSQGSHFPMLEHLRISSCRSLSEIPDDIGEIPTLKLIEVDNCDKSLADSIKLIQEEQKDYGDDVFQVRCINCEQRPLPLPLPLPLPPPSQFISRERPIRRKSGRASGMHAVVHMLRESRRI